MMAPSNGTVHSAGEADPKRWSGLSTSMCPAVRNAGRQHSRRLRDRINHFIPASLAQSGRVL
jgi:hypothetical protein